MFWLKGRPSPPLPSPQEFADTPWPHVLGAQVIVPEGTETTYHVAGTKGSLIEYGMCSPSFLPFLQSFGPHRDVPRAPHLGLHIQVLCRSAKAQVRVVQRPERTRNDIV